MVRARFGGSPLSAMRVAHGWSQSKAAEAWNARWPDDDKTYKTFSNWELWPVGGHAPSLDTLIKLAELYTCSLADLLAGVADFQSLDEPPPVRQTPEARSADEGDVAAPVDAGSPTNWYLSSLKAFVHLSASGLEAIEERVIVSLVNELAEVSTGAVIPKTDVTAASGTPNSEILFGGRERLHEQAGEDFYRLHVELPRPLGLHEQHGYIIRHQLPTERIPQPFYVCMPLVRCESFDLRIRFESCIPESVWRLDGTRPGALDGQEPRGNPIQLDRFGEAAVSFRSLRLGHAYGVRWKRP